MSTRAAKRYAKAFLELSSEKGTTAHVSKEVEMISNVISENSELLGFLQNPIVTEQAKYNALSEIFSTVSVEVKHLFQLLLQNKRMGLLNEVTSQYKILLDKQEGREVVYTTTAVEMSAELESQLLAKAKQISPAVVSIQNSVDRSLLGGFIIRVGDQQIDASIASKLSQLKNSFVQ